MRVGLTADARAAWLLALARTDLKSCSANRINDLRCEAEAFKRFLALDPRLLRRTAAGVFGFPLPANSVGISCLRKFQSWLKLGVHSLLSNEPWKFSLRLSHRIEVPRPFPGILLCQTEGEHTSALVLLKAMTFESLRDAQKRIALCRECRDPFIPRKQQRYCRAGCSQTARTRKWRGSDAPRIKMLRSAKHYRSIQRKTGLKNPRIQGRLAPKSNRTPEGKLFGSVKPVGEDLSK